MLAVSEVCDMEITYFFMYSSTDTGKKKVDAFQFKRITDILLEIKKM